MTVYGKCIRTKAHIFYSASFIIIMGRLKTSISSLRQINLPTCNPGDGSPGNHKAVNITLDLSVHAGSKKLHGSFPC